ncbi:MAG: NAD(P)H-hydrate dehydratase [Phycisphaerae bacterium]|nr:NAD(P)H-hydrate dehydratase [Phycisphaerae bacterium]
MAREVILTREIAPLPKRSQDAHKGNAGRVAIVGGCCDEQMMVGAVALVGNAALRAGCGLVQAIVPEALRGPLASLIPCATFRTLPTDSGKALEALAEFDADVLALGPGLGKTLTPEAIVAILSSWERPVVLDADGLNLLARAGGKKPLSTRVVLTPHPGEARRLLQGRGTDREFDRSAEQRREQAIALVEAYGGVMVLKGAGTIVTNGLRMYVNATGNPGMATGGAGDVLTGIIAGLIAQGMDPLEGAILGVYLHGLAGDFAAEEMGRRSMIATDIIDYLPEAFAEHELAQAD